ncbi:MAG: hypothetical protein ACKPKO_44345, partial [Candidatus Fonsibacter sp.]
MKFGYTDFDGCMYGFVSTKNSCSLPLRKPWRVAYLNSTVHEYLHRTCGSHPHVPCSELDAVFSQGHTPAICNAIHQY